MKSIWLRILSVALSLLFVAGYIFFPKTEEKTLSGNNGRDKLELQDGDKFSWKWTPSEGNVSRVEIALTGLKKAVGMSLKAELKDQEDNLLATQSILVDESGKEDHLTLETACTAGITYTLYVQANGEGSIKLKGSKTSKDEFIPAMTEKVRTINRNLTILFFAVGFLLLALTPVFSDNRIERKKDYGLAAWLPWMTLILILSVGLILVFMKPTMYEVASWVGWDEEVHYEAIENMSVYGIESLKKSFQTMVTWNPGYLPQAVGYSIGHLFTDDFSLLYRISVAFGLLAYAVMSMLAVKWAPRYKLSFSVVSVMPILLYLATSMTYDTMVFCSILLGIALLLRTLEEDEKISAGRALTLIALFGFGTVAKPVYSILLLLLLLIPKEKYGSVHEKRMFRIFVFLVILWCLVSLLIPGPYDLARNGDNRFADADSAGQITYIMEHPFQTIGTILNYCMENLEVQFSSWISQWCALGYLRLLNLGWLLSLLFLCPFCSCGEEKEGHSLLKRKNCYLLTISRRIVLLASALGAWLILVVTQYIVSSPVGSQTVYGMQGRYMLPVWIALILSLMLPEKIRKKTVRAGNVLAVIVFVACFGANLWYALHMLPV